MDGCIRSPRWQALRRNPNLLCYRRMLAEDQKSLGQAIITGTRTEKQTLIRQSPKSRKRVDCMRFTKMQGAGNDYVYVDCFRQPMPHDPPGLSRAISDRHFGVGGDGLILICPSDKADARMRMYNADGSESEMCGNGIRCVAKYVHDHSLVRKSPLTIETGNGVLTLELEMSGGAVRQVRVDMGEPILQAERIPTTLAGEPPVEAALEVAGQTLRVTCVSMGNPHCITFVDAITDAHVLGLGPQISDTPPFRVASTPS